MEAGILVAMLALAKDEAARSYTGEATSLWLISTHFHLLHRRLDMD